MANSGDNLPVDSSISIEYNQAKNLAFSLRDSDIERLRDEIQEEINRRAQELAHRPRENEEKRRREKEEVDTLYVAWKIKHFERVDIKEKERSQKAEKCKGCGSATESDSDYEGSDNGFEYPVEEIDTSEEDSDAAEEKDRMKRYHERKLRRFEDERVNPKIFSRTMREGESSDDDEELLDTASDEDDEDDEDEDSDESSSSDDSQVSPVSSGSDYSAQYEEEENWSYDEEDF